MSPDLLALARRAVACKGWRWMPGMLATLPGVHYRLRVTEINDSGDGLHEGGFVPVLGDPATLGCLLALVRRAWGEPSLSLMPVDESVPLRWTWMWVDGGLNAPMVGMPIYYDEFPSEAEALVSALEFAP